MSNFNKTIVMGRLVRDVTVATANSGTTIANFDVAASRKRDDREEKVFLPVVAFGKQAEAISKYFGKGKPILVEGRLKTEQWETDRGDKRSKICLILENFTFVGDSQGGGGSQSGESQPEPASAPGGPEANQEQIPF